MNKLIYENKNLTPRITTITILVIGSSQKGSREFLV